MRDTIIIVGAGPAGLAAAIMLQLFGFRVTILERRTEDSRPKPCGHGITATCFSFLEKLGVGGWAEDESYHPNHIVWTQEGGTEQRARITKAGKIRTLPRTRLEEILRNRAVAVGVVIRYKQVVVGIAHNTSGRVHGVRLRNGSVTPANQVIVASGSHSALRSYKREENILWAAQTEFQVDEPLDTIIFEFPQGLPPGGYVWFFPTNGGKTVNTGWCANGPRDIVMDDACKEITMRCIRRRFNNAPTDIKFRGGPISCVYTPPVEGGVIYLGDAAGLANMFTGEGITQALLSGILAAEALHRYGTTNRAHVWYARSCKWAFWRDKVESSLELQLAAWTSVFKALTETINKVPGGVRFANLILGSRHATLFFTPFGALRF